METSLIVLSIVWGVLGIVLFFKIWGMTNDIRFFKKVVQFHLMGSPTPDIKVTTLGNLVNIFSIEDIAVGDWCIIREDPTHWCRIKSIDPKGYCKLEAKSVNGKYFYEVEANYHFSYLLKPSNKTEE